MIFFKIVIFLLHVLVDQNHRIYEVFMMKLLLYDILLIWLVSSIENLSFLNI